MLVAGALYVFESDDACHGLDGDGGVCGCLEAPAGVGVGVEAGMCEITMGEEDEVDGGGTRSQGCAVGAGGGGLFRGPVGRAAVEEDADVVELEEVGERDGALGGDGTCERPERDHFLALAAARPLT